MLFNKLRSEPLAFCRALSKILENIMDSGKKSVYYVKQIWPTATLAGKDSLPRRGGRRAVGISRGSHHFGGIAVCQAGLGSPPDWCKEIFAHYRIILTRALS
jgi:hypothetical protein